MSAKEIWLFVEQISAMIYAKAHRFRTIATYSALLLRVRHYRGNYCHKKTLLPSQGNWAIIKSKVKWIQEEVPLV